MIDNGTWAATEDGEVLDVVPSLAVSLDEYKQRLIALKRFTQEMLVEGEDYGQIPGTHKPTLYKPGAEKLCNAFGFAIEVDCLSKIEDWDKQFFHYEYKARIINKRSRFVEAECIGSCNSYESKYRWTWAFENQVPAELDKSQLTRRSLRNGGFQYRIPNDQLYDVINTVQKMAQKRAIVGATLLATRASGIFTQDVEDLFEPSSKDALEDLLKFGARLGFTAREIGDMMKEANYRSDRDLPGKLSEMIALVAHKHTQRAVEEAQEQEKLAA